MIENELSDALFLQPVVTNSNNYGYRSRQEFSRQLKVGAVVGRYDRDGQFIVDWPKTEYYQPFIRDIADALSRSRRDEKYRQYKIASIEKGSLNIHLEWRLERIYNFKQIKFKFGQFVKQALGIDVLLLDMEGPAYEVVVPLTLDSLMAKMNFSYLRKITLALHKIQKRCVNDDYKKLATLTQSLSVFGHVCKDCPCLCSMNEKPTARELQYANVITMG